MQYIYNTKVCRFGNAKTLGKELQSLHLPTSCASCILKNEWTLFFPVQQQSQFPKDKIKRQQEVKSDQTWLLPCILPGVCLKCIQTWCGSGYIHIKDTKVGQSQTWTGQISLPLTYRACQRATEEPWLYLLAVISTPHCCCKSVDPQVCILRILMHLTCDDMILWQMYL